MDEYWKELDRLNLELDSKRNAEIERENMEKKFKSLKRRCDLLEKSLRSLEGR